MNKVTKKLEIGVYDVVVYNTADKTVKTNNVTIPKQKSDKKRNDILKAVLKIGENEKPVAINLIEEDSKTFTIDADLFEIRSKLLTPETKFDPMENITREIRYKKCDCKVYDCVLQTTKDVIVIVKGKSTEKEIRDSLAHSEVLLEYDVTEVSQKRYMSNVDFYNLALEQEEK